MKDTELSSLLKDLVDMPQQYRDVFKRIASMRVIDRAVLFSIIEGLDESDVRHTDKDERE